jgi:hypothetical protein
MKRLVFAAASLSLLALLPISAHAQSGATFRQWGEETLTKIEQDFRVPGSNLYYARPSPSRGRWGSNCTR